MAMFVVEGGHPKDMWYDESGLCAQTTLTIQNLIVNTIRRAWAINSTK